MSITIPLLDHLNLDLKTRFDFSTLNSYYGFSIVPSKMISMFTASGFQDWKEKFKLFINFYKDGLPNPLGLDGELDLWQSYWETYQG